MNTLTPQGDELEPKKASLAELELCHGLLTVALTDAGWFRRPRQNGQGKG